MTKELDAVEVEHLALEQVGHLPYIRHGRYDKVGLTHLLGQQLHTGALVGVGVLKDIDTSQSLLAAEVLSDDGDEIVEMLLLLEVCHFGGKLVKVKY